MRAELVQAQAQLLARLNWRVHLTLETGQQGRPVLSIAMLHVGRPAGQASLTRMAVRGCLGLLRCTGCSACLAGCLAGGAP